MQENFILKVRGKVTDGWGINRFPDGQVQVWIAPDFYTLDAVLTCRLTSPEDMHILDQFVSLIPKLPVRILYLYGSRCDKDTQGDRIVYNQHADLCKYLDHNDAVLMPHGVLPGHVQEIIPPDPGIDKYDVIVFPDESAKRRFGKFLFQSQQTVTCSKGRNQITGEIVEYRVPLSEGIKLIGKNVLVVDDICDGGATFKMIADEIRSVVNSMDLYVVHGIFSKPAAELFLHGYQHVYTTNSYRDWASSEYMTVFDVWN